MATVAARPTYSACDYWDSRYTGPAKNFDWFFNYPALQALVRQYLPQGRVLHVGCGNSNIQEGMASDGFAVTNVDISPVVIEQMKVQHAQNQLLEYIVADCRDMSQLDSSSFASCVDKGTLDAVVCSPAGQRDATKYLHEISRLLQPGGTFLLISLGAPDARVSLLESQQLWEDVRVLLLPKPLLYLQSDAAATGRPLPAHAAANKDEPIQPLGPWPAAEAVSRLQAAQLDVRDYFFAYVATKPASPAGSPDPSSHLPSVAAAAGPFDVAAVAGQAGVETAAGQAEVEAGPLDGAAAAGQAEAAAGPLDGAEAAGQAEVGPEQADADAGNAEPAGRLVSAGAAVAVGEAVAEAAA